MEKGFKLQLQKVHLSEDFSEGLSVLTEAYDLCITDGRHVPARVTFGIIPGALILYRTRLPDKKYMLKNSSGVGRHPADELSAHLARLWQKLGEPEIRLRGGVDKNFLREKHLSMAPVLEAPKELLQLKRSYEKPQIIRENVPERQMKRFVELHRRHRG